MKKKKEILFITNKLFILLILIATLFMSIGYASINSVIMELNGSVVAQTQTGVYIYDITYKSNINADTNSSTIKKYIGTNMSSYIKLSENTNSEITYTVSIYNSTEEDYYFDKVVYLETDDDSTYTNDNITYKLTNLNHDDILPSKGRVIFDITFHYADTTKIDLTDLTSFINYKFVPLKDKVIVYLNANGGTINATEYTTSVGEMYDKLPTPTYTNYTFVGWYDAKSGGNLYNSTKIVSQADNLITLYARWSSDPPAINNVPTITMTQNEAKNYYGQIVKNVNGTLFNPNVDDQRTWRVFYIDTENKYGDGKGTIYLKADEVSSKKLRFSTTFDASSTEGYKSIFNKTSGTRYYKITNNNVVNSSGTVINTKYLQLNPTYATGRKKISSTIFYENEKAAAYLSDPTQFTAYTDSRTNYAIGSPTVEMWIDSWNSVYGSKYRFYYQYNVNVDGTTGAQKLPGYQLKLNSEAWNQAAGIDTININNIDTTSMYKTSIGMWYSSPAIVYEGGSLIRLSSVGFIGNATINMEYAYSPVVSLNNQSKVFTTSYVE